MPPAQPSTPPVAPDQSSPPDAASPDAAERARYLDQVMSEIDAEVRRRRASGDLPATLERELDELFLEFSPVGLHGRARLRETLALVDGSAYVDLAVPVASEKAVGTYVKRLIKAGLGWYMGFVVHQIVRFAWAVSRMFHVVVDHVEDLETAVAALRTPELPAEVVPVTDPGSAWWADQAVSAVAGVTGRVLHGDCGNGTLLDALVASGVDAYGVDPSATAVEAAVERGLDARAEPVLDHLEVVASEALSGTVVSGSVQWLHPNQRDRLVNLLASRLSPDGVVVLQSATPESWAAGTSPLISDLAPGRPLHAETWVRLLEMRGFTRTSVSYGGEDRRLDPVASSNPDGPAINAAIDVVNALLLGPGEYLLVAARDR
ncbi:MAG: class I SAM-dependent methyltransferase [Acidimicrobiales bacterium]